ncbi:amidase domain-containing protein [Dehalobacterium formicoaceticum]|uniref:amidase domain-containing protein n=1 Tax=Dehalobacterium formicoaceticum TaxID=51515 RepID=UPI0018DF438D|nr:amidase domain-containing protein [Dehalobacterium formicoaceticum]
MEKERANIFKVNQGKRNRGYNRQAAVAYAHRWWNSYNPDFRYFPVDCTNYVSQVLYAGGLPMQYTGKQDAGWWYAANGAREDQWSFSWAVAHSLRWYLASQQGVLTAKVAAANELRPGDIICYDWDGDGVWQHNTVVVGFNGDGRPLVNAHTNNSQNRLWDYRNSVAWTEKTSYLFWNIIY